MTGSYQAANPTPARTAPRGAFTYRHPWRGGLRGLVTTLVVTGEGLVEEVPGMRRALDAVDVERIVVVRDGEVAAVCCETRFGPFSLRLPALAVPEAARLAGALRLWWRLA